MNDDPNPSISDELKKKWVNYDFLGKPFKLSDGKTYMRALSKYYEDIHFYCLEDDWFWHERPPTNVMKKVEKELSNVLTK